MTDSRRRNPLLTVVDGQAPSVDVSDSQESQPDGSSPSRHDLDWSILMARAQGGDSQAYRRLLGEITPYLRFLATRRHRDPSDVEDAVQDILLTIHAIRRTYDPTRPFGPWLVTIANRRLIDRLRRQGRLRARHTTLSHEHETFLSDETNIQQEVSDRLDLETALARLPEGQRQAVRLLKIKGMSLKEAATATGMSISALKVATHRALKNLRKILSTTSDEK